MGWIGGTRGKNQWAPFSDDIGRAGLFFCWVTHCGGPFGTRALIFYPESDEHLP